MKIFKPTELRDLPSEAHVPVAHFRQLPAPGQSAPTALSHLRSVWSKFQTRELG